MRATATSELKMPLLTGNYYGMTRGDDIGTPLKVPKLVIRTFLFLPLTTKYYPYIPLVIARCDVPWF